MGTREAAHTYRMRQWIERISQCRNSGKTVKVWCAEQGISETSFYYWQKQVREAAGQRLSACGQPGEEIAAGRPPVFTELEFPAKGSVKEAVVAIRLGEAVVEIQDGASVSTIENALHALKSL